MLKRLLPGLVLLAALASGALAQTPPGAAAAPPDPQQQVRETFQTIMQNIIAKGMDPQEIFQQLRNGTDPAIVEKQLIDKGIVDQQTLTQLHDNLQKVVSGRLRDKLDVTDAEWASLEPLIQKVMAAAAALERASGRMGLAGVVRTPAATGAALARASTELQLALKNPSTPPEKYAALLKAFRDARTATRAELDAARKELTSVLTVRQEGVLTAAGILE